jgi:hypothetical protein
MKSARTYKEGGKVRNLILEMLNTKKENIKKTKTLLSQINKNINKESLVIQLRKEFDYIKTLNESYKYYIKVIKIIKDTYSNNQKSIKDYYDFIKKTYHENVKIIDDYEEKMKNLEEEKKTIIKTNEEIYKLKIEAKQKLNTKLIEITSKNKINQEKLDIQRKEINKLNIQKKEERNYYSKQEKMEEQKIKNLIEKMKFFKGLTIFLNREITDNTIVSNNIPVKLEDESISKDILKLEDMKIKLQEEEIKNKNLYHSFKEISSKITNFSSIDDNNISTRKETKTNRTNVSPIISLTKRINKKKINVNN